MLVSSPSSSSPSWAPCTGSRPRRRSRSETRPSRRRPRRRRLRRRRRGRPRRHLPRRRRASRRRGRRRGRQGGLRDVPAAARCHTLADAGASGAVGPNLDETKPSYELVVDRVTNGKGVMPSVRGPADRAADPGRRGVRLVRRRLLVPARSQCASDGCRPDTRRPCGYAFAATERCPSGRRSATGNRVSAERCFAGSNPALSVPARRARPGAGLARPPHSRRKSERRSSPRERGRSGSQRRSSGVSTLVEYVGRRRRVGEGDRVGLLLGELLAVGPVELAVVALEDAAQTGGEEVQPRPDGGVAVLRDDAAVDPRRARPARPRGAATSPARLLR